MSRRPAALALAGSILASAGPALALEPGAAPVVFHKATKSAEVELRAPKALSAWPALRESLIASDTAKLNGFIRAAENSKAPKSRRNWRKVRYRMAGTTARLVSAIRGDDRDTGGAHPLPTVSGVIWDNRTRQRLSLSALFRPDADPAPLDHALCEAVKAAKAERDDAAEIDGKTWRCPLSSQSQAVLAPSTQAGKAGGLIVLINPYEVGPYSEGIYRVVVSLTAFRRALKRVYQPEFAGAPSEAATALTEPDPEPNPPRAAVRSRKRGG